jgi:hypothetical protein
MPTAFAYPSWGVAAEHAATSCAMQYLHCRDLAERQRHFGIRPLLVRPARRLVTVAAVLVVLFALPASGRAAMPYTYTLIADSSAFSDFKSYAGLSLSADGTVVFMLTHNNSANVIYTGNGGPLTAVPLIGPTGPVAVSNVGGTPAINAGDTIAIQGVPPGAGDGIFISNGGTLIQVVTNLGGYPFFGFAQPSINDAGNVAFVAEFGLGLGAFRSEPGGGFTDIVDNTGVFDGFVNNSVSLNDAGQVAFAARYNTGPVSSGVFVGSGGALTTIALAGGQISGFLGTPVINNAGEVTFEANLTAGGQGIFVGNGGLLTLIADTNGAFASFPSGPSAYSCRVRAQLLT